MPFEQCACVCRTYTTDYAGSVEPPATTGSNRPSASASNSTNDCGEGAWQATSQQLDRDMLTERAPILFSTRVPLYESEMDDHGVSACSVKACSPLRCTDIALLGCCVAECDGSMSRFQHLPVAAHVPVNPHGMHASMPSCLMRLHCYDARSCMWRIVFSSFESSFHLPSTSPHRVTPGN